MSIFVVIDNTVPEPPVVLHQTAANCDEESLHLGLVRLVAPEEPGRLHPLHVS